jgi:hypothetical protein
MACSACQRQDKASPVTVMSRQTLLEHNGRDPPEADGRAGRTRRASLLSRLGGLNRRFNPAIEAFARNIEVGMALYAKPNKKAGISVFVNPTVDLVLPDLIGIHDDLAG